MPFLWTTAFRLRWTSFSTFVAVLCPSCIRFTAFSLWPLYHACLGHLWASFMWHDRSVPIFFAASFHCHSGTAGFQPGYLPSIAQLSLEISHWSLHKSDDLYLLTCFPSPSGPGPDYDAVEGCRLVFPTTWTLLVAFAGYLGSWFTLIEKLLVTGAVVTLPWLR